MSTQPRRQQQQRQRQQEVRENCVTRFNNFTSRIKALKGRRETTSQQDRDRVKSAILENVKFRTKMTIRPGLPCKEVLKEYCNKLENLEDLETGLCWNWFKTIAYNRFREKWKDKDAKWRRQKVSRLYNAYKAKRQPPPGSATGTGTGTGPSLGGGGRNSRGKTTTKVSKRTRNIKSKSRAGKKGKTSTRVRRQTGGCGTGQQLSEPARQGQQLSEQDKRDLLTLLAEIQDKVKKYVDGLSDDQVDYQLEALLAQQAQQAQQAQLGPPLTQAQVADQLEKLEASLAHQGQLGQLGQLALTPQLAQVRAQLAQASKKLDQVRGHLVRI